MYQVKCTSGNEIQVISKGENGLCRVVGNNGETKYSGTYEQCVAWLEARAVKVIG